MRTELATRYAGSLLGIGWVLLAPLLVLGIYAAIYLVIFPFKPEGLSSFAYVLYIFAGLAPFFTLSEALSLAVGSVVANKAVLSNVVFPIDLVPPKAVLSAQGPMVVGYTLMLAGVIAIGKISWTLALLPVIWGLNILFLIGLAWFLSLLNIVFRDLQNLITAALMILLIASPIVYTPDRVPSNLKFLILANPFAYFVIAYQRIWILGELPTLFQLAVIVVMSLGTFALGGWFFSRAKGVLIDYV